VRVCTPRLASGAKSPEFGAGKGKNQSIRAEIHENGAGRWKNQPIRAKNPSNGAAPPKLHTTLRKFPQSSTTFALICPEKRSLPAKRKQRNRIQMTHQRVTY